MIKTLDRYLVRNLLRYSRFEKDCIDFFTHRKDGHMSKYLYLDSFGLACDNDNWNDVAAHEDYYLSKNRRALINKALPAIYDNLGQVKTVVELGPGSMDAVKNHTLPILNASKSLDRYFGIDISEKFATEAAKFVQSKFPSIKTQGRVSDFWKQFYGLYHDCCLVMLGNTIGNVHERRYTSKIPINTFKKLKRLRSFVSRGSYLIIDHDANRDSESLNKAYYNPAVAKFVTDVLPRIYMRLGDENFDYSGFVFQTRWIPEQNRMAVGIKSIKNQSVKVRDYEIKISVGEQYNVINSHKFSTVMFQRMLQLSGFEVVQTFLDDNNRMALYVAKAV